MTPTAAAIQPTAMCWASHRIRLTNAGVLEARVPFLAAARAGASELRPPAATFHARAMHSHVFEWNNYLCVRVAASFHFRCSTQ